MAESAADAHAEQESIRAAGRRKRAKKETEQSMEKNYKKQRMIITTVAIGQLIGALVLLILGVMNKKMTDLNSNILMGGTLLIYWILMDLAEPLLTHRLTGATKAQKDAYLKYVIFDFAGYAGIAYFLLGMGSNQSNGIIGAVVYAISMKPKQENFKIFRGEVVPEETEEEENAEGETEAGAEGQAETAVIEDKQAE